MTRFSKYIPEPRVVRPAKRAEKVALIRKAFLDTNWDTEEQKYYLKSLGLKETVANKLTDEEIDGILADLEKHRMILFEEK